MLAGLGEAMGQFGNVKENAVFVDILNFRKRAE